MEMKPIAHIRNDYTAKFGIPRQSGLVEQVQSTIVFEPEYRNADAFRGIEGWSHLWLIWIFSEAVRDTWSPTVLPPRLGGKTRMGVFATRSPFRPNPIGLSSVKLTGFDLHSKDGPVLYVAGADLMDGTPILDRFGSIIWKWFSRKSGCLRFPNDFANRFWVCWHRTPDRPIRMILTGFMALPLAVMTSVSGSGRVS